MKIFGGIGWIDKIYAVYGGFYPRSRKVFGCGGGGAAGLCSNGRRGRLRSTRTSTLRNASAAYYFFAIFAFFAAEILRRTYVRDPERFLVVAEIFSGALFQWQARTPVVDADVDPPKRKRRLLFLCALCVLCGLKILRRAKRPRTGLIPVV